ncbi:MAG: hypothetical protein ACREX5_05910, partial [Achromobacter pestifer]
MTAGALPARVLVLGLGYAGRQVAALLQSLGVACSGTVRDVGAAHDDGVIRYALVAGALGDDAESSRAEPGSTRAMPFVPPLREAIRCAEAVL